METKAVVRENGRVEPTYIGTSSHFNGNLEDDNGIMLDGTANGVFKSAKIVEICEAGRLEGEIHAKSVFIKGSFSGKIFANECIIDKTGVADGDIEVAACELVIAKGGRFQGTILEKEGVKKEYKPPLTEKKQVTPERANDKNEVLKKAS